MRLTRQCPRRTWTRTIAAAVAIATLAPGIDAQPSSPGGEQVVAGDATVIRPDPGTTRIEQASNRAIINWQNFDIGANHVVEFDQPSAGAAALNRVTGSNPSEIFGRLQANGIIYLVNPEGIVFGPGAMVNVGGLYAAAGHIADADFLEGIDRFTDIAGDVVVQPDAMISMIAEPDPDAIVALIGRRIEALGTITVPGGTAALVAGNQVLIGRRDGHVHVRLERVDADNTVTMTQDDGPGLDVDAQRVSLAAGDFASLVAGLDQLDTQEVVPAQREITFASESDIAIAAGGTGQTLSQAGLEALASRQAGFEIQSHGRIALAPMDNRELNLLDAPQAAFIADADGQGGGDFTMHVGAIDADLADDGTLAVTQRADAIVLNGGRLIVEAHRVQAGYLLSTGELVERTQAGGVEQTAFAPRPGVSPAVDGDVVVRTFATDGAGATPLADLAGDEVQPGALRLAAVRTSGDMELSGATDVSGVYAAGDVGEAEPLMLASTINETHVTALAGRNFNLQIAGDSQMIDSLRFGAGTGGGGDFAGPGGAEQDERGNRTASLGWGANQRPGSGQPEQGQLIIQGQQFVRHVSFETGMTADTTEPWSTVTVRELEVPAGGSFTVGTLEGQTRFAQAVAADDFPVGVGAGAGGGFELINPDGAVNLRNVDTVGGSGQRYVGQTVNIESVLDSRGGDITIEAGGTLVIDSGLLPSIFKTQAGDVLLLSRGGNITISAADTIGFRDDTPGSLILDSATDAIAGTGDISFGGVAVPNGSFLVNAAGRVTVIETSDQPTATVSAQGGSATSLAPIYAPTGLAGPVNHLGDPIDQVDGVRIDTPELFLVNAAQPPFLQSPAGRVMIHATDVTVLPVANPRPVLAATSLADIVVDPVIHEPKFELSTQLRVARAVTIDVRELIASIFDTHREEADEPEAPETEQVELTEADNEILVLMGLVPRQLDRQDVRHPPVLFRDVPEGLDDHEYRVTVHRLDPTTLRRALENYRTAFLEDPDDPASGRYEQIRASFEDALLTFIEDAGDYDAAAFGEHLRRRDDQAGRDFVVIERLLRDVRLMGLTPVEAANSRREMLQRVTPTALRLSEFLDAFAPAAG